MKLRILGVACLGLLYSQAFAADLDQTKASAKPVAVQSATSLPAGNFTNMDKISYAIGVDLGSNFKNQGLNIDVAQLTQGLKDALTGGKILYSQKEIEQTLIDFQKQLLAQRAMQMKQMSDKNTKEGQAFLTANKAKPGIVTLPNGLQYKVITEGTGAKPSDKDTVTVDYTGSFIDGKVFDSSTQHGKPITTQVSQVIPGWTQALKMMKVGSVWEIYVPAELAYGAHGYGPIEPNQALVFKIKLISIDKKG